MFKKAHQLWIVQFAEELCDQVAHAVRGQTSFDNSHISGQLIRAGDSVVANLVEGYARQTTKDSLRFYSIARGSLEETIQWLRRSVARGLIERDIGNKFIERFLLLSKSLDKFIRYHQNIVSHQQ
jgi:four helix bundle protein